MPGSYQANRVTIVKAANVDRIAELEWGSGPRIAFTHITSCIGLFGHYGGASVVGVHLPFLDAHDFPVVNVQVGALISALRVILGACSRIYLVGERVVWHSSGASAHIAGLVAFQARQRGASRSGNYAAQASGPPHFIRMTWQGGVI